MDCRYSGRSSIPTAVCLLTEEVRQQLGLIVVHRGHTNGVEAHQAEHRPIEGLSLHYLPD